MSGENLMNLNEKIISLREKNGLSQKSLADKVGINKAVMNRIELGDREIRYSELKKLIDVLDVDPHYFFSDDFNGHKYALFNLTQQEKEELKKYLGYLRSK